MMIPEFRDLPPKEKEPASARILDSWVNKIALDSDFPSERVGWLIASAVTIGLLQKVKGADNQPLFLLKGGVYIERRLELHTRATRDVDTLFRGSVDEFLTALDECIADAHGVFSFERTEIEIIENAPLLTKPRRFNLKLKIKGVVWRKIQVEVGFPEGNSSDIVEKIEPMRLDFLGLESVDEIATISLAYQVAQKIHGASAFPLSADQPNTRVRDVIDLVLISQEIFGGNGTFELHKACIDTFETRASELETLGHTPHTWPPTIQAYPTWASEYKIVSERLNLNISMNQAIDSANAWITSIAKA